MYIYIYKALVLEYKALVLEYMFTRVHVYETTHCNTLQHTATHGNTLQRTALLIEHVYERT